jgi:CelD/BcsL family acetyltransferase involved in cellulose biosynthesis
MAGLQQRRNVRLAGRALAFPCATSEALEPILGDLFRLHAARWNGRLRGLESFHAEVALGFLREGMLRGLTVLRLDGRAIAAVYAFATRGRTWFYLSGFDPRFEKLSPGTVAVGNAIDLAAAEGHVPSISSAEPSPTSIGGGRRTPPRSGAA